MSLLLYASAFIALVVPQNAAIQVNVNAKTGDTLTGMRSFRVTVDSSVAINQVEFYVGDTLTDTETSTPYMFTLDTIDEPDGDYKLRFKAYTVENKTAEQDLSIHIDNKISAGADFHVQAGLDALTDSKWQQALDQGRIALKIDPKSNGARIVLARANLGLNALDKAQKFAEDAVTQDPKSDVAYQLLAGIAIKRAFATYAKEGADKTEVLNSIADSFKAAIDARNKSLDIEVDSAGQPSGDNLLRYADVALRVGRYSLALAPLQQALANDPKNEKIVNRVAYAQLRSGRYQDAAATLEEAKRNAPLNAYGDALSALVFIQLGQDQKADDAMKLGIEDDPDDLGVRTAQTFIALKRNKTSVLSGLATDLARDQDPRPDVNYFLMALADRQQRFTDARRSFEFAVLADPTFSDLYVEQANYSVSVSLAKGVEQTEKDQMLAEAKMYYQTAINARPEATDALAGVAIIDMFQKNSADAVKFAEAARDAAPGEALGHYAAAAAYQMAGRLSEAQSENTRAGQLDQVNLEGRQIPNAAAVWRYLTSGGRIPIISRPL